tara:strand:+ start:145 stop:399 length:255 start_codon:yes stop_codon:yes gene_type:complete
METEMKQQIQEMKTKMESEMEKQECKKWSSEYELVTIGNPKTKKNFVMTAGKNRKKSIKKKSIKKKSGKKGGKKTRKKVLKRKH